MIIKELMEAYGEVGIKDVEERQNGKSWLLERAENMMLVSYFSNLSKSGRMSLRVYRDGYVLYEEGKHYTVFRLEDLEDFTFTYDALDYGAMSRKDRTVSKETFMEMRWYVALSMFAMMRIAENVKKEQEKIAPKHLTDGLSDVLKDGRYSDFLRSEVNRECVREILKFVKKKHWLIFAAIYFGGLTQNEIAERSGVSQQAISKIYVSTLKKLSENQERFKDYYAEVMNHSEDCPKRYRKGCGNKEKESDKY
jgi:RNA polymerase sigma factor (sigma-70 family)